jgi:hypothetical protein
MRTEVTMIDTAPVFQRIASIQLRLRQRAALADTVGLEAARVLALLDPLPALTGTFSRSEHPSTRHLAAAFAAGDHTTAALAASIRCVGFDLPWRYSYAKRGDAPGLEENMAFAEIIGPDAPFASERVCLGLTLIGSETFYPPHCHPAVELYLVVAGRGYLDGRWSLAQTPSWLFHPP